MTKKNIELWEKLEKTDPKFAKNFSRGGGFKGTATNPTYIAKKLTEAFGPIGIGWGYHVVDERYIEGAPLGKEMVTKEEAVIIREVIHVVRIQFWHGDRENCFESYGQTTFVGKNKRGLFTDEEAPKKSMTDAFTKAAAQLGASADIHMGLWDDNKYVNDRRSEFGSADEPADPGPPPNGRQGGAGAAFDEGDF